MENQPTENIDIPPPELRSAPLWSPRPEEVARLMLLEGQRLLERLPVRVFQGPVRVPYAAAVPERLPSAPTLRAVMEVDWVQSEPMQAPAVDWVPLTPLGTLPLQAIVVQQSAAIRILNNCKPFLQRVGIAISIAAAGFRHLWDGYYQGMALGEENVRSSLEFTVGSLFAMVQLKGQGIPGFPFQTHPHTIIFTTTGIVVYCLASVVEFVISAAGVDRASAYAIIAHLVRMGSFSILVGSLASLLFLK